MVKVNLPHRYSAGRANSGSQQSSQDSNDGYFTSSSSASGSLTNQYMASRERDNMNSIDAQLKGLHVSSTRSSIDMSGISDALQAVEAGQDSRPSPLLDPSPSPRRLSADRRRSSSRRNLEKHDVRDEAPPNDRFNLPAVQKALRNTKDLMSELADVLGSSSIHNEPDSVMQRLHRQAEDLAEFQCPSTRIVGFVGDSGAGKSSLLNSLLDYRDLARSSNSGAACTCVVTEFHFHDDEEFAIMVERFSEAELMPQLENLLRDYRHFHLNRDSLEAHELVDFEKRAKLASDTFHALFRGHFVESNTFIEDTEFQASSMLKSWVQDFDQSMIQSEYSGLNLRQCSTLLMELTSDTPSDTATIWPVSSNAHILSKGLILVDLPGLRDLNSARRNITERYLLKCDEIFVVAVEGRATTDEGVQSVIELAKKARLSNVGIICTRSDEVKATEALKDWKGKGVSKKIQHKLEIINQEDSEAKDLEEQVLFYDSIDVEDLSKEEEAEINSLNRKLRLTRKRLDEHEFELQKLLITTRNAIVEGKLITLYKHEVPDNLLQVFCASNTMYWDHRDAPKVTAMPYLNLSGVLAIREHCMAIVSESQYMAATKYMRDDIGVLLGELDLWVQSGQGSLNGEKKEKIRNALDTLGRKLKKGLLGRRSALNNVADLYKKEFKTRIYRPQETYSAFCRNYGTHSTAAVGPRSWNQEIIEEMTKDMNTPWDELQMTFEQRGEDMIESIDNLFDLAYQFLDTELDESPEAASVLSSTLLSHNRVLEADIEVLLNELQEDLRIRTSFVGQAMEHAYTNARLESGTGSDARRKAIINSAVRQNGLFPDLLKRFKRGFEGHVNNCQELIQDVLNSHYDAIWDTFQIIRNDNVALESEKDPEFRGRVKSTLDVTKERMERVQSILTA
ncbi:hypothetical protein FHL15_009227 [Xylaria flabelliformis]|uniref:G domain-containing protein n=1 Tax=Xylaria flabelliformis TaxID=2512241 RepID=A0A553HPS0_9PEZI|nr:hypothetical protein FHL15_009227 [Xylaria flabelliformis]